MKTNITDDWSMLTAAEKKRKLYDRQIELLDTFLAHRAISRQQYEKSRSDLTVKMGYAQENGAHNAAHQYRVGISPLHPACACDILREKEASDNDN